MTRLAAIAALCLAILGCHGNTSAPNKVEVKDPVAELKALLAHIEDNGTEERVTDNESTWRDGEHEKGWVKRKYRATKLKYDVKKTDSLVSPIIAVVTWVPVQYTGPVCRTREEAANTNLAEKPSSVWTPKPPLGPWAADLTWQDGQWVLKELGWDGRPTDYLPHLYRKYNVDGWQTAPEQVPPNNEDPVKDWWQAFGGNQ